MPLLAALLERLPPVPTAEKRPLSSGWASTHSSLRFRYSRVVSSFVPAGVSKRTKKSPLSWGGKSSASSARPMPTAATKLT